MPDKKWRQRKVNSFRCSDDLLEKILGEAARRNTTFSGYVRDAAIAEMNRRRWIVS
jgi:hypothetical protein